jgi:hypothetical protein
MKKQKLPKSYRCPTELTLDVTGQQNFSGAKTAAVMIQALGE